ncbi:MAG: hypothetical protein BMS9Abin17_0899 [Acidimicrobiia bacterium]|nr:MAG: hypothetical protein BMS9Abin17_0899 [Acidimicrobiia bacterium]
MTTRFAAAVAAAVGESRCVVALGGGADSALLLAASVEALGQDNVRAVFVFHGLPSSKMLETSARDVAAHVGVEITVLAGPIEGDSDIEDRARTARYAAIEADLDASGIALTGHTANDQAETVLMRLARGSGAGGLSGIPFKRGPWRRPFLEFSRVEINVAATDLGIPFVDDPANTDDRYFRSVIRGSIIPTLERDHAPGLIGNIAQSASLLAQDDALLRSLASSIPVIQEGDRVLIAIPPLLSAPRPVTARAVRSALRLVGDSYPGTRRDVESVIEVARTGETGFVTGHVQVLVESPFVVLQPSPQDTSDERLSIEVPGEFVWNQGRYVATVDVYPTPMTTAGRFSVVRKGGGHEEVEVRGVLDGDTLDIGTGSARVVELLREHGVSSHKRPGWLLVIVDGKIAAVHGVRTASWAKPKTGDTVMIIEREVHS